ncbi:MAG: CHAT domain-containing protein [Pseudomonadota bacterium]
MIFDVCRDGVSSRLFQGQREIDAAYLKMPVCDLEKVVRKFRRAFEISTYSYFPALLASFDADLANRLGQKFLGKLISRIPCNSHVVIVPDGCLSVLPFEALLVAGAPDAKGETPSFGVVTLKGLTYLGDRYRISYAESLNAYLLAEQSPNQTRGGDRMLVVADPVYGGRRDDPRLRQAAETRTLVSFRRLPLTGEFAKYLTELFPGKVESRVGFEATKNYLVTADYSKYGTVVVAGYLERRVYADSDGPKPYCDEPGTVLSLFPRGINGRLRASEIDGLRIPVDLVFVLGCQPPTDPMMPIENEVMPIGWAFRHAGAKSVVVPHWTIFEEPSTELARHFFNALKQGMTKTEALRHARRQIREHGYDHPYYWASYILLGQVR